MENEAKYDDTVAAGKVIATDPAAGTEIEEGKTVKMYVSKGREKVDVPDLVGKTTDEATAALSALGLSSGNVTEEYSDEYEAGKTNFPEERGRK